jgi:hypothetical protein
MALAEFRTWRVTISSLLKPIGRSDKCLDFRISLTVQAVAEETLAKRRLLSRNFVNSKNAKKESEERGIHINVNWIRCLNSLSGCT